MATLGNKKIPFPTKGMFGYKGAVWAVIEFTIGASGAVSSTALSKGGLTVTKTATKTGRYTLALPSAFKHFLGHIVSLTGPADAIYGANTIGGPGNFVRNNNIDRGTKAGTIDLQFSAGANNADAELASGTVVNVVLLLSDGV